MKTRLTAVAFALAMAAAIFLLVVPPAYSGFHDGRPRATLIEINGEWAIVPVIFPVLVALGVRKQVVRIIAAIVMDAFALISFSIGLFYLPAGILMALAACVED